MRQDLMPAKVNDLHAQAGGPDTKKVNQEHNIQQLPIKLVVDNYTKQKTGPEPTAVRGQQQGLNTPPSGREGLYSSLPSKHLPQFQPDEDAAEGFMVPPMLPAPGRTQPTPSASRSIGAEVTGEVTSKLGIWCSLSLKGRYPSGHLHQRYVTNRQTPR